MENNKNKDLEKVKDETKEKDIKIKEHEENKGKTLMHACCGPCSVNCIDVLNEEEIPFDLFWFNPNIHPYTEYKKRKETLEEYAESLGIKVVVQDTYELLDFTKKQIEDIETKCSRVCYTTRLEMTAKVAKELGYSSYTTTLLVSPYQDTEKLIELGKKYAEENGLEFIVKDFKSGFRKGQAKARELGMYMQKYCGCVFSEAERYKKHTWKIKNV